MAAPDCYLILNPAADRGRAAALEPALARAFRDAGARYEIVRTAAPGHAVPLAARAAAAGWPVVVAVGGDGVVHEVANGLLRAAGSGPTAVLGVVAAGSGNDFAKLMGSHRDLDAAVRALVSATPRAVDVGAVTRCIGEGVPEGVWYFTNGIGLGLDAQVAAEARGIRRLRGMAIYAWALVRTLRVLDTPRVRVTVDGREVADRPLLLATIANGPCHGGSFWLCPDARLDDGLLDVLLADARSVPEILRLLPRVMRGRHLGAPGVALHLARRVQVRSEAPLPIHADGEIVADAVREVDVEVLPGRLRVAG